MLRRFLVATLKQARRLVVAVVGLTVVLIGVLMVVTPGPAIIVIPAGLAILATEFVWAKRLLKHVKERVAQMAKKATGNAKNKKADSLSSVKEGGGPLGVKTVFSQQKFLGTFSKETSSSIAKAVEILQGGGLVAFPTETVYGLGARVFDPKAISKIFEVKGRPLDNPLIVHVSDVDQLAIIAKEVPPLAEKLIKAFWPGPLTLILPRAVDVPPEVSAGLPTIAVRMPNQALALELIRGLNEPIAAPSANRSGRPSPTKAEHILRDLGDRVDMVLDGGLCTIGLESTVLDLSEEAPRILRHGVVTAEDLEPFIGKAPIVRMSREAKVKSPGLKHRHYAPNVRVVLVEGKELPHACKAWKRTGKKIGVFSKGDCGIQKELLFYRHCKGKEALYAQQLFSVFRDAEMEGIEVLLVERVDKKGLGVAIMDRLERAEEGSK